MIQKNLIIKEGYIYRHRKQTYGYQSGWGGEESDKLGVWD